jgi:uncharacterized protein (DUF885 family)
MKKTIYLAAVVMLLCLSALSTHAEGTITPATAKLTKEAVAAMTPEEKQARLQEIKQRVEEMRAMDMSTLTKAEKKEYKAEVRELKQDSKLLDPKFYVIIAAIVIIIILILIIV